MGRAPGEGVCRETPPRVVPGGRDDLLRVTLGITPTRRPALMLSSVRAGASWRTRARGAPSEVRRSGRTRRRRPDRREPSASRRRRIDARGEDRLAPVAHGERCGHEAIEQRVRPLGPRLELGMELAGHEPRMVPELDDLDQPAVGRLPGQDHAGRLERLAIAVVHLEAVAMALVDDLLAVDRGGLRAGRQLRRVEAEAHRAALVLHLALVGHEVDDRVGR